MSRYLNMTKAQAAVALDEFLDERGPALERLRERLAATGHDPNELLDSTVDSLIPLWQWVKSVLTEGGNEDNAEAPSWVRYGIGSEPTLSRESVAVVDGVTSYLCQVVEGGAPAARWRVGHHRTKSYIWQNYPVLAADGEEAALADIVPGAARGQVSGRSPSADDELARTAAAVIKRLKGSREDVADEDEPVVEVEDLGDDPHRGRELELSLREDIAHEHSSTVDRLAKALGKQDGITGVLREDREVLLVATPTWTTAQLEEWATEYLTKNLT